MKNTTRGQIQISFNWIFVLIIGTIFLIFFFSLISGQTKTSEKEIAVVVGKQFETVFKTTLQDTGTFKKHETTLTKINFVCDPRDRVYYYEIAGKQANQIASEIIFAPQSMHANLFYTWTQTWNAPYDVANFMYLTTKEHAFIFANITSSSMEHFRQPFPVEMSTYELDTTHIPTRIKYDKYTYVFFLDQLQNFGTLRGEDVFVDEKDVTIVIIDPALTENPFAYGNVTFLDGEAIQNEPLVNVANNIVHYASDTAPYLGKASLYGALFSDDKEYYTCTMDKAFERLQIITLLNYYRVNAALETVAVNSDCETLLAGVLPGTGLDTVLSDYNQTIRTRFSNMDTQEIESIYTNYVFEIDQINYRLLYNTNCMSLY